MILYRLKPDSTIGKGLDMKSNLGDTRLFSKNGRIAVICIDSFAGRIEHRCRVVGETPKKYRIEVDKPTPLPPRSEVLDVGMQKLVPKHCIRFIE